MAYAAVILLKQNLEEILHPCSYLIHLDKEHIGSLHKEVDSLRLILEGSYETGHEQEMVKTLEIKIRVAAQRASDIIDSHVYINNTRPTCLPERDFGWMQITLIAHQSFTQIVNEIKSVHMEAVELIENKICRGIVMPAGCPSLQDLASSSTNAEDKPVAVDDDIKQLLDQLVVDMPAGSPFLQDLIPSSSNAEDLRLVGVDDDIKQLLERVIGDTGRQVIPIVGMAGIGKTTIAKRIYIDALVVYHFDMRAWITIPQDTMPQAYRVREMLLGLLKCLTNITDYIHRMDAEDLGKKLYQTLKGKRYLVVLDDMWRTADWDDLKRFLPDDNNGSRIVLTSQLDDVFYGNTTRSHCMHFLKAAESWALLESKLFPKERCPHELIEIGKQIAFKCQGLPLAIVVVAGILNRMEMTLDSWMEIAGFVGSPVAESSEHYQKILALSYKHLPNSLRPCFLYTGAFPREYKISASRLIWFWIAEGFVLPISGRCLEDVAYDYLEELVNRNLVIVGKRRSNGRIKTCHVHDLLRVLCLREAQKENFLFFMNERTPASLVKVIAPRRISLHATILRYQRQKKKEKYPPLIETLPLTRTFLCYDMYQDLSDTFLLEVMDKADFKLLRVLDIELLPSNHFPIDIADLIHLSYLALSINCELPRSISKLQKLQTLIITHIWEGQYLPREIWKMPQLRHIRVKKWCYFPLPYSGGTEEKGQSALQNLETLSTIIGPVSCSKEVFACLPGLRKLEILATESDSKTDWSSECFSNLVWLNQLETLKCSFLYRCRMHRVPRGHNFPANLKKLTLSGSYFPWEDMDVLAALPKLEVLKLVSSAFEGVEWRPEEGGFLQLKLLLLENSDPWKWYAEMSHFPNLRQLVLKECCQLEEIPEDIGNIPSLQKIEVHNCISCVEDSARKIHEQQQELGNDELDVRITRGINQSTIDLPVNL